MLVQLLGMFPCLVLQVLPEILDFPFTHRRTMNHVPVLIDGRVLAVSLMLDRFEVTEPKRIGHSNLQRLAFLCEEVPRLFILWVNGGKPAPILVLPQSKIQGDGHAAIDDFHKAFD